MTSSKSLFVLIAAVSSFGTFVECITQRYYPPILNYDQPYVDIPVKSNFIVQCEGRYPLLWKLPAMWKLSIEPRITIKEEYNERRLNSYKSTITVSELESTDTGFYSCYYQNTTDFEDKAKVTSIYLFANDPDLLFVQHIQWGFTLFPSVTFGPESVIPCLPTHSNTNVTLLKSTDFGSKLIPFGESLKFDPMRGMILRYPSSEYSGVFSCQAEYGDKVAEMSLYIIYYGDTPNAPEPIIERIGLPHAIANNTYKLRCVTRASIERRVDIQFEYPAKGTKGAESRIIEGNITSDNVANPLSSTNIYTDLYIKKLLPSDEGIYKCIASDHVGKTGMTEMYLKVLNTLPPAFVNLTTDLFEPVEMPIGTKNVRFVVKYYVYPSRNEVEFIWRKDNQFLDDKRHEITERTDSTQLIITIKELKREDSGKYTLEAKTKDHSTNITIELLVTETPKATIISSIHYLQTGKNYELLCSATGSPKPMIWWTWKPCIVSTDCNNKYENVDSSFHHYITSKEFEEKFGDSSENRFITGSGLNITAKQSGYYKCNANNQISSHVSEPLEVIVSEATNGLDIIKSRDSPIVMDNVTLTCRANIFEFEKIQWYWIPPGRNQSESEQVPVSIASKPFNHSMGTIESRLLFSSILQDHSGTYLCAATYNNKQGQKNVSINLLVRDLVPPVLNSTNMLNNVITVEKTKEFEFFCYANGVPEPKVSWFKDQTSFNISSMPGVLMIDNGQKIIINRLVESDSGVYMCRVENRAGIVRATLSLSVEADAIKEPIDPTSTAFTGIIVGIVVVLILFILVGVFLARRMYKDKKLKLDLELEGFKHFDQGRLDMYNPDLPLDDQAELLPYDKRWEFPKERLILGKTLGQGAFGRVVRAEAIGISDYENSTTVAVKMLKEKSDKTQLKALVAELKIMIHLGKHLNVVNLLGAVTRNIARGELMVLVEFCKYGNLRHYLLHQRRNFIDQISPENGEIDINITSQSSVIGKNRKMSLRTTENDQAEKQLHYADIVHAYKKGISREHSRTTSHSDSGSEANCNISRTAPSSMKNRTMRSDSNASNSFKQNNSMHKAVLGRSISNAADATAMTHLSHLDSFSGGLADDILSDNSGSGDVFSTSGMNYKYKGDMKDTPINTCDLLCFSFQIARGMEYLSSKKLIHRDLAARNILLAEDNVVKICDFGLAKDCYKYSNYVKKGDGPLPIKWMAIESIRDKVFTTQTDVWSYAILLWEIFTLGGNPYPGIEVDEEFFKKLRNGYRMEKPEFCPNNVFKTIEECWEAEPHDRPNFPQVAERMGDLLEGSMKKYYIDLNNPFVMMNEEMQNNNDYLTMEGKNRDSNYLNMRGSSNSENMTEDQTGHYDNIRSVRPVGVSEGEKIVLKPPMEVVPMIQFADDGNVKLTNYSSDNKECPKKSPKPENKDIEDETPGPQLTDYIYMGSPKKKEFADHPFAINAKQETKDDSVGCRENIEIPPSYKLAVENNNASLVVQV